MEARLGTYRHIIKCVTSKADLCTLCRVNKGFQLAAEHELYHAIHAEDASDTLRMCSLFAKTPRLAAMVRSLTLSIGDEYDNSPSSEVCLRNDFWPTISAALRHTTGIHLLNLHLDVGGTAQAWILSNTTFQLRSFHCDLQWDACLVSFLNSQPNIDDLYIVDYPVFQKSIQTVSSLLDPGALPNLSTLECTFCEAACALVPTRPVSRLKTCFSKTRLPEKKEELSLLFSRLTESMCSLRSLDIADSSYSESFSMDLLSSVLHLRDRVRGLRYLGTLVLPIDGNLRLKFYGFLRLLRSLECVEVDVSEWEPPPSVPAGVRALTSEMQLYCPSLYQVILVNDFERTVIAASHGTYTVDCSISTKNIWRQF